MCFRVAIPALSLFLGACAIPPVSNRPSPALRAESRVYDVRARRDISLAALAERAAQMDVVFFGEQHDDPATHRAELALLAAIGERSPDLVLSLEMFERDVQPVFDAYLRGEVAESVFLAQSRPWPRYTTDYRAMVELSRARGWAVVASNVPRPLASAVSRGGLAALDTLPPARRALAAKALSCPRDRYFDRFAESMKGHGAGPGSALDSAAASAMVSRFYEAQCVKDETMGEAIAAASARTGAVVVHYNGAFHTDRGLGTAERARRRMPRARSIVVTAVPVADPRSADPAAYQDRADYVILTPRPPTGPTGARQ